MQESICREKVQSQRKDLPRQHTECTMHNARHTSLDLAPNHVAYSGAPWALLVVQTTPVWFKQVVGFAFLWVQGEGRGAEGEGVSFMPVCLSSGFLA